MDLRLRGHSGTLGYTRTSEGSGFGPRDSISCRHSPCATAAYKAQHSGWTADTRFMPTLALPKCHFASRQATPTPPAVSELTLVFLQGRKSSIRKFSGIKHTLSTQMTYSLSNGITIFRVFLMPQILACATSFYINSLALCMNYKQINVTQFRKKYDLRPFPNN